MKKVILIGIPLFIFISIIIGVAVNQNPQKKTDEQSYENTAASQTATTETHNYVQTEVLEEPSCYKEGKAKFVCSDCGAEKEDAIPAEGHDWEAVGGVSSSKTCRKCQSFKLGYSDIKPNDWMIGRDNSFIQFKNAMVDFKNFTASQAVYVRCTPVCSVCRIAHMDDMEYFYVSENAPISFTYKCVECGASTDVGIVLRY